MDCWRLLCVVCVVVVHADESYAKWNMYGTIQWVLQFIMVISGTCFAFRPFSFLHLAAYTSRLATICSFGCAASYLAAELVGNRWWGNPMVSIGYQNTFLLLMAFAAAVSSPLKALMDGAPEGRSLRTSYGAPLTYLVAGVLCICGWVLLGWADVLRPLTLTCSMLLLASLWSITAAEKRRGLLGWFMLLWMYASRVCTNGGKWGYWFHLVDIYCWAMAVQRQPLLGQRRLGLLIVRNWPFLFIAAALVGSFPGSEGRHERNQYGDPVDRARFNFLEVVFMIAFVVVPSVGVEESLPIAPALAPHLAGLTYWGLLIFTMHRAVYYVIEPMPWGLAVNLLSGFVFMPVWHLCHGWRPTTRLRPGHSPAPPCEQEAVETGGATAGDAKAVIIEPEGLPREAADAKGVPEDGLAKPHE